VFAGVEGEADGGLPQDVDTAPVSQEEAHEVFVSGLDSTIDTPPPAGGSAAPILLWPDQSPCGRHEGTQMIVGILETPGNHVWGELPSRDRIEYFLQSIYRGDSVARVVFIERQHDGAQTLAQISPQPLFQFCAVGFGRPRTRYEDPVQSLGLRDERHSDVALLSYAIGIGLLC